MFNSKKNYKWDVIKRRYKDIILWASQLIAMLRIKNGVILEVLIGTIIGALIAGLAMILNSYYSARRQEQREDHLARRKQLEKDINEISKL